MLDLIKITVDGLVGPTTVLVGAAVAFVVLYLGRRWFVRPVVAGTMLAASLVFLGASLCDRQFAALALAPDNIPIVAMLYLLAFFIWLATAQAVENDRRDALGESSRTSERSEKVFTWPDLVYSELICAVAVMTLLIAWSLAAPAPLEQPANPALTPNPSKAPWYFLGMQELLFHCDAWFAGVAVPCLIVLGLMAIPYLDFNPEGSGRYTIARRRFAYLTFQFGFWQLCILLIVVGTFWRGPNWGFFGLYEIRDPQKPPMFDSVDLSQWFWVRLLGRELPAAPESAGRFVQLGWVVWREIAGVCLLATYFLGVPPLLCGTLLRGFRQRMGIVRLGVLVALLLLMAALWLKMLSHEMLHLRHVVAMPECSFYF
jgi:hypothetical protein